jgi:predicted Holliday junction resolvase-like endonuclease
LAKKENTKEKLRKAPLIQYELIMPIWGEAILPLFFQFNVDPKDTRSSSIAIALRVSFTKKYADEGNC